MKKLFTITFFSFLIICSCQESTNNLVEIDETATKIKEEMATKSINEKEETTSIMQVIDGETKCFYERDYDCWKNYWVQQTYTYFSFNNTDGTYSTKVGWDIIDEDMGGLLKNNPVKNGGSIYPIVKRKNFQIKFMGNKAAYLLWEQYQSDGKQPLYRKSQEVRLMEKINGVWKIVQMSALWDYENMIPAQDI